jgi:hypothetical protein
MSHHKYLTLAEMGEVKIAYLDCPVEQLDEMELALIEWFDPPLNGPAREGQPPQRNNRLSVSVPDSLYERLVKISKAEGRSLSNLASCILECGLDRRGR